VKRTALKRKTPMRRKPAKRKPRANNAFVAAVHGLRCVVSQYVMPWMGGRIMVCAGPIEADHMGDWSDGRGTGQTPDDTTCVALCRRHHRQRHDHSGVFAAASKAEMQAWRREMIKRTRALVEGAQEGSF
jgi:hypothetical protein